MSTTQRSENINAFFDGFVNSKTNLTQFVKQYENALRRNAELEWQADAKCFSKNIPCVIRYEMEKQVERCTPFLSSKNSSKNYCTDVL